jgi:hypothetical protein
MQEGEEAANINLFLDQTVLAVTAAAVMEIAQGITALITFLVREARPA